MCFQYIPYEDWAFVYRDLGLRAKVCCHHLVLTCGLEISSTLCRSRGGEIRYTKAQSSYGLLASTHDQLPTSRFNHVFVLSLALFIKEQGLMT